MNDATEIPRNFSALLTAIGETYAWARRIVLSSCLFERHRRSNPLGFVSLDHGPASIAAAHVAVNRRRRHDLTIVDCCNHCLDDVTLMTQCMRMPALTKRLQPR